MSRARSPWKYSAVEHRNQQEVEKVPKQTETQEYWFQKNISFHLSLQLLQLGDFPLTSATTKKTANISPNGNDILHSEYRKAKELLCWQTVPSAELVSTFSSSALLCIQNSQQLSLTTRATSPDYLSSASWMPTAAFSLRLSLPVRKILSTQCIAMEPPVSFTCTCFMQGRPSHPRLLRPWDPEILLPKYSYTLRILSEWDLIP